MVSLNGTLIVQMIAFIWAWWFLDTYLLRPVAVALRQEATTQQEVEMALEAQRQNLAAKDRYKQERWFHFQLLFARSAPRVHEQQIPCTLPEKQRDTITLLADHDKQVLQSSTVELMAGRITREF